MSYWQQTPEIKRFFVIWQNRRDLNHMKWMVYLKHIWTACLLVWKSSEAAGECVIILLDCATSSPSWTTAVLTDLCGTRWQLYEKSWDVPFYDIVNALAQTTECSAPPLSIPSYLFPMSFLSGNDLDICLTDTLLSYTHLTPLFLWDCLQISHYIGLIFR